MSISLTRLEQFGKRLARQKGPEKWLRLCTRRICELLPARAAAIYLRSSREQYLLAAASGLIFDETFDPKFGNTYPISQHAEYGHITIVSDSITVTQHQVMLQFAADLSSVTSSAALIHQLREARNAQVVLREEERRRLRRNLHNSIGPTLAALNLHVRTVEDLVRTNPSAALEEMALIRRMTSTVITDIRRVIYGLRPPALDELGFAEALRVQASVFRTENLQIELQMPQTLPALTAAEEVAAYRIVLEALSNVSNHSDATICAVRCEARADGLHVSVDDNGTIKVSEIRSGVGISSMRELASELGGKCELQPSPLGGLRVCAWLPQRSPGRTL